MKSKFFTLFAAFVLLFSANASAQVNGDVNGDGKVDEEDGLKVTCIAVSDADGNTVLLMTADLIGGNLIERARTEICTRVEAALASGELKNVKLTPENIYYAGTHTHENTSMSTNIKITIFL